MGGSVPEYGPWTPHTFPAGQLDYGRAAVRWATDYFIKCHTAEREFYGQVGDGYADHAFWGRPEDMTMYRPAFKIHQGAPGAL